MQIDPQQTARRESLHSELPQPPEASGKPAPENEHQDRIQLASRGPTQPRRLATDPAHGLAVGTTLANARGSSRARRYVIKQGVKAVEIAEDDRGTLPRARADLGLTEAVTTSEITNLRTQTNKARLYFRRTSFCEPSETYVACGKYPLLTKQQWFDVNDTPLDIEFSDFDAHDTKVWETGYPYFPWPFPVRTTLHETNYTFTNENLTKVLEALGVDVSKVEVTGFENLERQNALEIHTKSHGSITLDIRDLSISQFSIRVESHEAIPPGLRHHFRSSKKDPESGADIDMVGRAWDGYRWDYVKHPGGEPVRLTRKEVDALRDVPASDLHEQLDRYGR